MDDYYWEELIRIEAEQLAIDEFGAPYVELTSQQRLCVRELVIDRLGAGDQPEDGRSKAA